MARDPLEYSDIVMAHFRAPRNAGGFPEGTPDVTVGEAGNRKHGREIRLELKLADGRVEACRYRVYGCPATIALCSVLSERVVGCTREEAVDLGGLSLAEELELPVPKRAAALLLEDALRAALGPARYNAD
ncbi:MAG TPA: iron-sulfur cluster assembly scaffold protein [Gammaproteobacteria bacterium]|nr:iron-sulfur cluster assembly scaffold protein [Gammaproteobacteria bacterium]